MRIGGWRQIGAHRRNFDAPASWRRHLAWSFFACAMVRHRMLLGVSLAPGLRVLMSSTTYPGQAPFTDSVVGQGCFARKARTGAGFPEICPLKSRTQLRQVGVWLVRGAGNLEIMLSWAFRIAQMARASVPMRKGSGYIESIAEGYARWVPRGVYVQPGRWSALSPSTSAQTIVEIERLRAGKHNPSKVWVGGVQNIIALLPNHSRGK